MVYIEDKEKTTFFTKATNFCYEVMLFSLTNVRVTYQRLMNNVFREFIEKIVEVYTDDMVVKFETIK